MSDQKGKSCCCGSRNILVPDELVEHSAFLDKESGINDSDQLTRCQRYLKYIKDDIVNSILISPMQGYSVPIQFTVGLFLKAGALALFVYFITTQYISTRATTFISLDVTAGDCKEVPLSVTGVYTMDVDGNWLGSALFNPSAAYYSFSMSNFLKTSLQYEDIIYYQKSVFASMGKIGAVNELADNLLYWTSWSQVVDDNNAKQRWQMSGDAKVVFDRQNYLGAMGNQLADCIVQSSVAFNAATGKFVMTYSHKDFLSSGSCYNIIPPESIGYDSTANGDTMTMEWDGVALTTAQSVNKKIAEYGNLVEVTSGFKRDTFVVDGVKYVRKYSVDSRYPNMDPVMCFEPDLSFTPTAVPTSSPTVATLALLSVSQSLSGVTLAAANSTSGRSVLQDSIATVVGVPSSAVAINGVSSVPAVLSISTDGRKSSNQHAQSGPLRNNQPRTLAGEGVVVKYTVRIANKGSTALAENIKSSISNGALTSALRNSNQPAFSSVAADTQPSVVDQSPTSAPTSTPTAGNPSPSSGSSPMLGPDAASPAPSAQATKGAASPAPSAQATKGTPAPFTDAATPPPSSQATKSPVSPAPSAQATKGTPAPFTDAATPPPSSQATKSPVSPAPSAQATKGTPAPFTDAATPPPSVKQSLAPSASPSPSPSVFPSPLPSAFPSSTPPPSQLETQVSPVQRVDPVPTLEPSALPSKTLAPSVLPSALPSPAPSAEPSRAPTTAIEVSRSPTVLASSSSLPSTSSSSPSTLPSLSPSSSPSTSPSTSPSSAQSSLPSTSSSSPSTLPSLSASSSPSTSPSTSPSSAQSSLPSQAPTVAVTSPSVEPTISNPTQRFYGRTAFPVDFPFTVLESLDTPDVYESEEVTYSHLSELSEPDFNTSSRSLATSAPKTFCLIKINNVLGYPFFMHYGPAGTAGYNMFTPQRCLCGEKSGTTPRCSEFDIISGFVLFKANDVQSIIRFDRAVDNINKVAYDAAFASINLSNGQAVTNKAVAVAAGASTVQALSKLEDSAWRASAYSFCTNGCLGVVVVNSFDTYNTAVNGAFHQVVNGSCNDVFTIPTAAWATAVSNPPTSLTAGYYKCQFTLYDCVFTAIGVGSGIATSIIPFMILFVVWLCTRTCLVKKKLIVDMYDASERERAMTHLITHLLTLRDKAVDPMIDDGDDSFLRGLLSGNDMSPGRKSFREMNKRQVGNSEVGISQFSLLNQDRSNAA